MLIYVKALRTVDLAELSLFYVMEFDHGARFVTMQAKKASYKGKSPLGLIHRAAHVWHLYCVITAWLKLKYCTGVRCLKTVHSAENSISKDKPLLGDLINLNIVTLYVSTLHKNYS